LRDTT